MTFPVGNFSLKYFREIFPMGKKLNRILFFSQYYKLYISKYISNWFHPSNSTIIFSPRGFLLDVGKFWTKIPMFFFFFMFLNKFQNLFLPLIKLRLDCVSSYYVLLNVCHTILNNFTYPMGVKAQIQIQTLKTCLLYFQQLFFTLNEHKYSPLGYSPAVFFPVGNFSHG